MYQAMVVDDEKWTLMGICRTFRWEAYGFELAFSSTDPDEALAFLLANHVDVAFLDIRMPGFTGIEIIERARQAGVTAEFVIISGIQDFGYALSAIRNAAFDYCLKPLTQQKADETLAALAKLFDMQGKRKGLLEQPAASYVHSARTSSLAGQKQESEELDNFSKLLAYIDENYASPLQLKELSASFFLSPNYVSSLFRQRLNTTFGAYVNDLRIKRAEQLLKNTNQSIEEVARLCGYADAQYFIRVFRTRMQQTPLKYRKEMGK